MFRTAKSKLLAILILVSAAPITANAQLVTGLQGAVGSTVGPDGALYVPEAVLGIITRIDTCSGDVSTFASGLPTLIPEVGFGGATDIAFLDGVAYVLVTMVDSFVGGSDVTGVYRMDGADSFTPIADIGAFAAANPPSTPFDLASGVQYSMEVYRGRLLVADGHHNRVLEVRANGNVSILKAFDNIVPTGLEVSGKDIFLAQAGPAPHEAEAGKVVAFRRNARPPIDIASGARLATDVEFGSDGTLYVLSQGEWNGDFPGSPALPGTGALFEVTPDGGLSLVADELNLPSSMEFVGNDAWIVNLLGEVWVVDTAGE